MTTTPIPMTELSTSECWGLIRSAPVGRLAVALDDGPDIFPVNHVVDHGTIVFRTAAGTKLFGAVDREVAFEVDGYDAASASAWSVVVKGYAVEIARQDEALDAMTLPIAPWHEGPKGHIVRIEADSVTGRRFVVTPRAQAEQAAMAHESTEGEES